MQIVTGLFLMFYDLLVQIAAKLRVPFLEWNMRNGWDTICFYCANCEPIK